MTWTLRDSEYNEIGTHEWPADTRAKEQEADALAALEAEAKAKAEKEAFWGNVKREAMWPVDVANTALNTIAGMIQLVPQGLSLLSDLMGSADPKDLEELYTGGGLEGILARSVPAYGAAKAFGKLFESGDVSEVLEYAAGRGEGIEQIPMLTEHGKDVERGVHFGMELPSKASRWGGGLLVDAGLPPYLATVITTPLEFALYAVLFKSVKGSFPKGFDPSKISVADLRKAETMIRENRIPEDVGLRTREALKTELERRNQEGVEHMRRVRGIKADLDKKVGRKPSVDPRDKYRPDVEDRMRSIREQEAELDRKAEEAKASFEKPLDTKTPTGRSPYVQKLNEGKMPAVKAKYDWTITDEGVEFTKSDGAPYKTKAAATHLKKTLAKEGVETEAIKKGDGWVLREKVEGHKLDLPDKHISEVADIIRDNGPEKYSVTILENRFGTRIGRADGLEVFRVRGPGLPRTGAIAVENQLADYGLKKPWVGKYKPQTRRRVEERVDDEFVKTTEDLPIGVEEVLTLEEARRVEVESVGNKSDGWVLREKVEGKKLTPREYQEKYPEKTVHLDWDKANSPRFVFEGAGDILREFQKSIIDPGYIGEKLARVRRFFRQRHPDDTLEAARKHEPDKLKKLINEYKNQPVETVAEETARDAIIALMEGRTKEAKRLYSEIEANVDRWAEEKIPIKEEPLVKRPPGELLPTEEKMPTFTEVEESLADIARLGDEWTKGNTEIDMLELVDMSRELTNSISERMVEIDPLVKDTPANAVAALRGKGESLTSALRKRWRQAVSEQGDLSLVRWDKVKPSETGEPRGELYADPLGKPFRNERSAREWAAAKSLEGDVVENPDGAGWLIEKAAEPEGKEPPRWLSKFVEKTSEAFDEGISLTDETGALLIPEELGKKMERLRDRIRTSMLPSTHTITYRNVYERSRDYSIASRLNAFDVQTYRDRLFKGMPDQSERYNVSHVIENTRPMEVLSDRGKAFAIAIDEMFKRAKSDLADADVLHEFLEDYYVNHVVKGITRAQTSWIRNRLRVKDLKTGRIRPITIQELLDQGFDVEQDIGVLAPTYLYGYRQAIINKEYADGLINMKTPEGDPIFSSRKLSDDYVHMETAGVSIGKLKRWARFGRKQKHSTEVYKKALAELDKGDVYIHKDAIHTLSAMIPKRIGTFEQLAGEAAANIKRVIMYNVLVHGLNAESNVAMALGPWEYLTKGNLFARLHRYNKLADKPYRAMERFMVESGSQLQGIYDIQTRLSRDVYDPRFGERLTINDLIHDPGKALTHPIKAFKDINDFLLWDKWIKSGQMAIFYSVFEKARKEGMSLERAGRTAAMVSDDMMGTLPMIWFTNRQSRFLRHMMFARNWNVGQMRTLTGAVGAIPKIGPKIMKSKHMPRPLRFEGMTDQELKFMGKHYGKAVLKGVIGMAVLGNAIQAAFLKANDQPYHPTWNNEEGHRMDIDTGTWYPDGSKRYLKNWLYRQVDDWAKLFSPHVVQHLRNKLAPLVSVILEGLFNIDYARREIVESGAPLPHKIAAIGKYLIHGLTPLESFVGYENQVREFSDLLWTLTGTYPRKGMPIGHGGPPALADFLIEGYKFTRKQRYISKRAKLKLSKAIQKKQFDKALELASDYYDKGVLSHEQIANAYRIIGMPFFYRVFTKNGKIKSEYATMWLGMSEKEKAKYGSAIKDFMLKHKQTRKGAVLRQGYQRAPVRRPQPRQGIEGTHGNITIRKAK